MKKNNYLCMMLLASVVGLFAVSCENDSTEEDIIAQQQKVLDDEKAEQDALDSANAEAIAAAGKLLDYSVHLHSNNEPIAGATITVTNQNSGESVSATTDALGNAAFVDIGTGGFVVTIASENHLDMSYVVDFGSPTLGVHYQEINDNIVPTETAESSKIEALALSGMQTATIKGKVKIETDLTNSSSEVPQDLVIRANLDAMIKSSHSQVDGRSILVEESLTFSQGDVGTAAVDNATGEYAMVVPATADGTSVTLVLPTIETDQTLAWSQENGEEVGLQYGAQPALFGPEVTATATPEVAGVRADFPPPPPPGRGFQLVPTDKLPRQFVYTAIQFPVEIDNNNNNDIYLTYFDIVPGSGYQLTPSATISAPGLEDDTETIVPHMQWDFISFEVTDGGSYAVDTNIFYRLMVDDDTDRTNGAALELNLANFYEIPGEGEGIPEGVQNIVFTTEFDGITDFVVADIWIQIEVLDDNDIYTPATISNVVRNGSLQGFAAGYTDEIYTSIPTITLGEEGGAPTEPASITITDMAFQYKLELDNSGNTQDYVKFPKFEILRERPLNQITAIDLSSVDFAHFDTKGELTNRADALSGPGFFEKHLNIVKGNIRIDENDFHLISEFGKDMPNALILNSFSHSIPKVIVIEPEHEQASALVNVDNEGSIDNPGLSSIFPGSGYNDTFEVDIVSLGSDPGAGGQIQLTGFTTDPKTGEVTWNESHVVTEEGAGYKKRLNIDKRAFSGTTEIDVENNGTYIINIDYGTGKVLSDLGPEPPQIIIGN